MLTGSVLTIGPEIAERMRCPWSCRHLQGVSDEDSPRWGRRGPNKVAHRVEPKHVARRLGVARVERLGREKRALWGCPGATVLGLYVIESVRPEGPPLGMDSCQCGEGKDAEAASKVNIQGGRGATRRHRLQM